MHNENSTKHLRKVIKLHSTPLCTSVRPCLYTLDTATLKSADQIDLIGTALVQRDFQSKCILTVPPLVVVYGTKIIGIWLWILRLNKLLGNLDQA